MTRGSGYYPLGFIEPCLPTVSRTVPTGTGWAYEIKHDGFRSCVRQRERVRVISRGAARLGSADYQRWSTLCWRCPPAPERRYVDYRPELPRLPFPDPEDALDPLICPELPTVPLPVLDDEPAALEPLVCPEL